MSQYDFIFLSECWILKDFIFENADICDNYEVMAFPRSKGKGGGLILMFKKYLKEKIKVLKVVCDTAIWVQIRGELFNLEYDVFCLFTYVPHENNVFYNTYDVEMFNLIEQDVAQYSTQGSVMAMGDWNSRVGLNLDFIENDDINNDVRNILNGVFDYDNDSIMHARNSEDTCTNSFGRKLIRLCKATGLRLCNGRISGDEHGKITFFNHLGTSVIDYALTDSKLLEHVKNFRVLDFNEWSDHAPIVLTFVKYGIEYPYPMTNDVNSNINVYRYKWNDDYADVMKNDLMRSEQRLFESLNNIESGIESIDQCVSNFSNMLKDIFEPYCKHEVNMGSQKKVYKVNKPWFDEKCKTLYSSYRKNLKCFNATKTHMDRYRLIQSKKQYKRYCQKVKSEYQGIRGDQLEYIRRVNPKEFYRQFNKKKSSKKGNLNIQDFHTHFSRLGVNENPEDTDDIDFTLPGDMSCIFEELDSEITLEEIQSTIRKLNNGKSPGRDFLLNEYFSKMSNVLSPMLKKMFDAILKNGYIPKVWCEGVIVPVPKKRVA